ncbi:MAG TPA: hypothetical protein VF161_05940 [Steroidobacteraceae bacterium]
MPATKEENDFSSTVEFHRREWRVQRLGWIGIWAFMLLAVLGLFGGSGPLNNGRAVTDGVASVEYERYTRQGTKTTLNVTLHPETPLAGTARIALNRAYFEAFRLYDTIPAPKAVRLHPDQMVFEFSASGDEHEVTFVLEPEELGWHNLTVAVDEAKPLTIRQFTYP